MNYEQFSKLWDVLEALSSNQSNAVPISNGMSEATASALTEYGMGDKSKIEAVRSLLNKRHGRNG